VPGVSASQCQSALDAVNWDTSMAVKNLKVDRLYRLGVAEKAACQKVLENDGWDLERAAAMLLDQCKTETESKRTTCMFKRVEIESNLCEPNARSEPQPLPVSAGGSQLRHVDGRQKLESRPALPVMDRN